MQIYLKSYKKIKEYESYKRNVSKRAELKEFEPYVGRIEFKDYIQLFNFDNNIYSDKTFKYSIASNYNKRLMPELASACVSSLVYNGIIDLDVRMLAEQYLIAMMSNMDFVNIADFSQLNKLSFHDQHDTLFFVFGSCPGSFDLSEYHIIINERIKTAKEVYKSINGKKVKIKSILRYGTKDQIKGIIPKDEFANAEYILQENKEDSIAKLTKNNISNIFNVINGMDNVEEMEYNLVLVCSSFHIMSVAYEIEKYFHESTIINRPCSLLLIGGENIFDFVVNYDWLTIKLNETERVLCLKKIQSFFYELYFHSLNKR